MSSDQNLESISFGNLGSLRMKKQEYAAVNGKNKEFGVGSFDPENPRLSNEI